jgi:hypothetical protein
VFSGWQRTFSMPFYSPTFFASLHTGGTVNLLTQRASAVRVLTFRKIHSASLFFRHVGWNKINILKQIWKLCCGSRYNDHHHFYSAW